MAAPKNLSEYYAKMLSLRNQLKTWKNELLEAGTDLAGVTKAQLMTAGLNDTESTYEIARLTAAKAVYTSLTAFDNASV
jgi:hypothetical protein